MMRVALVMTAIFAIPVVAAAGDDAVSEPHFRLFTVTTDLQRLLTRDDAGAYLVVDAASVLKDGKLDEDSPVWQSIREALRDDGSPASDEGRLVYQCYFQHGGDRSQDSTPILDRLVEVISEGEMEGVSAGTCYGDEPWDDWIDAASATDGADKDEPAVGEDNVKVCPVNTVLSHLLLNPSDPPDCYVSIDLRGHEDATGIPPAALDEIIQLAPQLTLERKREICFAIRGSVNEFENERSSLEKLGIPESLPHDLGFETWSMRRTVGSSR